MRISRRTRNQITAEAVDWFLQFQEPEAAEPDHEGFSEWLLRSPAHVEEYLQVSSSWYLVNAGTEGMVDADALISAAKAHHENDNVVPLPSRSTRSAPLASVAAGHGHSRRTWWMALAATLVLGGVGVTYLNWQSPMIFETAVGKQDSFKLQDGSVVFLNTNSRARVSWSVGERHVELERGEARFAVARDPNRPFTVTTATATVRVVGTVFNVRAEPHSTQVAVLEGQVEVTVASASDPADDSQTAATAAPGTAHSPTIERVRLAAGERAAVTQGGIQTNEGPAIESVAAWTERRLVFRDQPLGEVIREFNRYRTHPLLLDDAELAALRINGVFDPGDPDSLLTYLGLYETVQVDHRGDGSQRLFRGSAAAVARKR
ncbi:MAG TPA: FecR domain-containing protein [Steroidobacteraceae bacterium]